LLTIGIYLAVNETTKIICMKKYLVILFASVLVSTVSNAQKFRFGPKLGANVGKIDGKGFSDEYTLAYHVGGFAELHLGKKWAIQPEVLWNQIKADTASGFSQLYTNLNQQNWSNLQLSYLSIPVLLTYKPAKILSLQAGPQFGILIDQNKNFTQNGADAFKKGDLSMLFGAQINILKLRVYGRYAVGLNNISDIQSQEKWKNTGFQLGVGFAL
jgi:hypothetical protein